MRCRHRPFWVALTTFTVAGSLLGTGPSTASTGSGSAPAGAAARTAPLTRTDQRIHDKLVTRSRNARLGSDLAGLVTDLRSGQVVWANQRAEQQLPASNTKLATAVNALQTFGPGHRFRTRVVKGTSWRRVVLVGGGDPSLSSGMLATLATATTKEVRAHAVRTVTVLVDDTLFPKPSLATGWKASYVPTDVRAVRALVVDEHEVTDTSIDAGKVFAAKLKARGIRVRRVTRGIAPADATLLASVSGTKLRYVVSRMLRSSDNDHAEALHRLVAIRAGYAATWAGAGAAQRAVLRDMGVDLGRSRLYDGSGLSRADRLSPAKIVEILSLVFDAERPRLASMQHNSLAVAGRTGTLGRRYLRYVTAPTSCAAGLIEAKTGSLRGVIALSGFARGADGRIKLFSFLLNGVPSTLATRRAVDRLASTVTGCW